MNNTNLNSESRSNSSNFSTGKSTSRAHSKETSNQMGLQTSQLMTLFVDELKDIYWAEKALTKAIPKMIKNAKSHELIQALTSHLSETVNQVSRVEQVFEIIRKKNTAKKCEAMEGLIQEAEEIMLDCEDGAMRDAGIISAAQKVEHYEIASYGTLRKFAETLGLNDVVKLLQATLEEEKTADQKLTQVSLSVIKIEGSKQEEEKTFNK